MQRISTFLLPILRSTTTSNIFTQARGYKTRDVIKKKCDRKPQTLCNKRQIATLSRERVLSACSVTNLRVTSKRNVLKKFRLKKHNNYCIHMKSSSNWSTFVFSSISSFIFLTFDFIFLASILYDLFSFSSCFVVYSSIPSAFYLLTIQCVLLQSCFLNL